MKTLTIAAILSVVAGTAGANPFIDDPDLWPTPNGVFTESAGYNLQGESLAGTGTTSVVTDVDIYGSQVVDNIELSTGFGGSWGITNQPSIGDRFNSGAESVFTDNDIYHGFEIDNIELSTR